MKRRPRMLFKLLLFVLAGAIFNVAVAWGCQLFCVERVLLDDRRLYQPYRSNGYLRAERSFGLVRVSQMGPGISAFMLDYPTPIPPDEFRALIPSVSRLAENAPLDWGVFVCDESFAGWPFLAVHGSCTATQSLQSKRHGMVNLATLISPKPRSELPLLPLWPGFAINTIFYAAIVWMLFAVPGAVRRRVRIKRGQCASCGYSLRDSVSEKCPECGAIHALIAES